MKINSVYLKNFRVHSELNVEFSAGLNLLLGQNGSGKSSILEAIGVTLFSSKYRDGNSNGQGQVIKFGEKEALVKIEFVGNDEITYIIEKQFKNRGGYNRLYRKEDKEDIIDISKEIEEKLKSLLGIDGDLGGVYDDIIVSKQNEFINIYKQTEKERRKTFDKIFETDIYRKIYENFSKETEKKYSEELKTLEVKISTLTSKMENFEELEVQLKNKSKDKEIYFEFLKSEEKKKNEIVKKIEIRELLEKELINEKNIFTQEKQSQENLKENSLELVKKIEISKKSQEIIEKERENHQKYNCISKEITLNKEEFKNLERKVFEYRENEKKLSKFKENISEIEKIEEIAKSKIDGKSENLEKLFIQEEIQVDKLKKLQEEKIQLEKELFSIEPKIVQGIELQNRLESIEKILEKSKMEFKNFENSLKDRKKSREEKGKLDEIENKIDFLEKKSEEKENLKNEITKLKALLEQNKEAQVNLSGGLCPYLGEGCKNIQGFQGEEYFKKKSQEIESESVAISQEISKISEVIEPLEKLKESRKEIFRLEKEIEKLDFETKKKELEKNLVEEKYFSTNLEIKILSEKNGDLEDLKTRKIVLNQNFKNLQTDEKARELKETSDEIKKQKEEISSFEKEIKIFMENREAVLAEKDKIETSQKELSEFLPSYESKKVEIEEKERELEVLKESYTLYNLNFKTAEELGSFQEKKEFLILEIDKKERNLKKIQEKIQNIENKLLEKEKNEVLKGLKDEIEKKIAQLNIEYGALKKDLESLEERLKKALKEENEIKELKTFKLKLDKKLELTKKFRGNISGMGDAVSSKIIRRISFFATDNFRKITGRGEAINWSNEDSSAKSAAYSVVLEGLDIFGKIRKTNFDQLSGGEQVAVAIAIRGAMINLFTKTRFTIFDEPTNNLDLERRKSLADNIGEILQELEQSIIVTHDDTFKEMAQKVIELK